MSGIDLSSCAEEPIRIPESIQPFGSLLVFDSDRRLARYSLNSDEMLNPLSPLAPGIRLSDIFPLDAALTIDSFINQLKTLGGKQALFVQLMVMHQSFGACFYRSGEFDVLELVPTSADMSFQEGFFRLRDEVQRLLDLPDKEAQLDYVVRFIKELTGFDRVMVYRFDAEYNGVVCAEAREPEQEAFLGLHYPASDIPAQARALYKENLVRYIADVEYTGCELSDWRHGPVDMSQSLLRSISPMHIQYMKNMGVRSTLVGSLLSDTELWGLVACHNSDPTSYDYSRMELFRWLVIYFGNAIEVARLRDTEKRRAQVLQIADQLMGRVRQAEGGLSDLFAGDQSEQLLKISGCSGAACYLDGEYSWCGLVPTESEVKRILRKLTKLGVVTIGEMFVTDKLPSLLEEASSGHPLSAGVALMRVQGANKDSYFIFFRKEVVRTVNWAGNPDKMVEQNKTGLTPRSSFSAWKAKVSGTSRQWESEDKDVVRAYLGVIEIELKARAERELQLLSKCVESINDSIIITDNIIDSPGPRIVFVNKAFEMQTGYSKKEALGQNPRMLQCGKTDRHTLACIRNAINQAQPIRVEILNAKKNKELYWSELDISPIFDKRGEVGHFISVQRDITLRRSADETLRFIAERNWNLDQKGFLPDLGNHVLELTGLPAMLIATCETYRRPCFTTVVFLLNGRLRANFSFEMPDNVWGGESSEAFFCSNFEFLAVEQDLGYVDLGNFKEVAGIWLNDEHGFRDGVILLLSAQPVQAKKHISEKLKLIQIHVALDLVRKKASDAIWLQANYDLLTGIPNRRMFNDRLAQALKKSSRTGALGALLLLDLDNFKEVNDLYGHPLGDKLLIRVVERIKKSLRDSDTFARLGGDEFIIILEDLSDFADVSHVAAQILENMSAPIRLDKHVVYSSFSIGISVFPTDSEDAEQLIAFADQAMYAAKSRGRNQFMFFTAQMQEAMARRAELATDLRKAIENDELAVHYQPIIDMKSGRVVKAEALLRWHHPKKGLISPADFIPVAEETGQIIEIGDWVFHRVANYTQHLRNAYDTEFKISVNKSPVQFRQEIKDQLQWVEYLQAIGLPASSVIVEITESSVMDDVEKAALVLGGLQEKGVEVALDDFGTGYSAMAYLQRFDIDYLKIDQSFIRAMDAHSGELPMVEAIIVMAKKLGIQVIAEGVETEEQATLLKRSGADFGQGFFFARPLSSDDLEDMLKSQAQQKPS
ncbi:EAL domain-containing protein [Marinobacter sediminum]|uniref:EAL domain-containing protein n=1 Tax=Marinobacter sediminum TaxID=256323 RepID=UPI00193A76F0|nr:EAL domain-containing protein [Marinobacter sediminum]